MADGEKGSSLAARRGWRGLVRGVGVFGLCGPLIGGSAAWGAVELASAAWADVKLASTPFEPAGVAGGVVGSYIIGILPAVVTGLAASLYPLRHRVRFVALCAVTGLVTSFLEVVACTFVDRRPFHFYTYEALSPFIAGAGAFAALACALLVSRIFAGAAGVTDSLGHSAEAPDLRRRRAIGG